MRASFGEIFFVFQFDRYGEKKHFWVFRQKYFLPLCELCELCDFCKFCGFYFYFCEICEFFGKTKSLPQVVFTTHSLKLIWQ